MSAKLQKVFAIILFSVFFGLLEAIVVIYIRQILGTINTTPPITSQDIAISFGVIAFLRPTASLLIISSNQLLALELWREAATIVMLTTLAWVTGTKLLEKLAYLFLAFAFWDLFYYIFLGFITGRPNSLLDPDVFFLLPLAWVGPVITPVVISLLLVVWALFLLLGKGGRAKED